MYLKFPILFSTGIIVASAAVFIIDLQSPLGIVGGLPYALIVMATYWTKPRRITVGAGILGTVLTGAGFFLAESSENLVMAVNNRLMAIIVIWAGVWFVSRYKTSIDIIQRNEKRISALFEAVAASIIISDMDGNIVMVNEKTEELFGYSREELIGETIERLVPERHRPGHKRHRLDYYEKTEPRTMGQGRDLYGLKNNGEEFPVEIGLNHLETEDGKFVISYVIDITQRKQLNKKLEKSEERLLEAQRLAHLGNFEQDLETGELLWSDELFRIFDMDPKGGEPSFSGFMKMIHPEDRNRVVNTIDKVRKETKPQFLELRIITHSGRSKYIFNIINPLKNQAGEIVKIFGTTHDITQHKKTENKLKEHEHRYRTLFQAATDEILVFQVDEQMNPLPFLEVNDTACNILGYSRNELLQKIIYDIVATDKEEVDRRIELIIEEQEVVRDSRHKTKEGDIIPLEISSRAFKFNGRHTIVSIGRDIRERLELEQEILNISDYERQRIGHDLHDSLGQMLSGIGLLAQSLVKKSKKYGWPGEEEIQDITDMIREADQQARALSRGLVPIYLESDGLDAALNELADRASKLYRIDIHYQPGSANIQEDNSKALHLYRIVQEAINNAVKHGKATSVEVELSSFEDQIFLRIQDNGSGFSEPEERSDGMGLRIMHFRSQMIGGDLKINSEKGEGTEVTCHIPTGN